MIIYPERVGRNFDFSTVADRAYAANLQRVKTAPVEAARVFSALASIYANIGMHGSALKAIQEAKSAAAYPALRVVYGLLKRSLRCLIWWSI